MTFEYPEWLRDPQDYAVQQERYRHDQALNTYGEFAMFVLRWTIRDFKAGLVERCSECMIAYGKIADTYQQPARKDCPACYGTSFEGGIRAKIVRTSLWDANEEDYQDARRGESVLQTASVQSTSDFRMRTGDYIFRADGSRWQMRTVSTNALRTGFLEPEHRTEVGYNYGLVQREDEDTVAYMIPPATADLIAILDVRDVRYPPDFSAHEEINGSLQSVV